MSELVEGYKSQRVIIVIIRLKRPIREQKAWTGQAWMRTLAPAEQPAERARPTASLHVAPSHFFETGC